MKLTKAKRKYILDFLRNLPTHLHGASISALFFAIVESDNIETIEAKLEDDVRVQFENRLS